MKSSIRIGTRGSQLARWQSDWVSARLREAHPGLDVEVVEIKTQGDLDRVSPLAQIGGQGLFTKEIQRALLDGRVEVAVHSLKDLPTRGPDGLVLGAVPVREEVNDALISPQHSTLEKLPVHAKVGTGSQRRKAQLLHLRRDLEVVDLRGNVGTRLAHAIDGRLDAVVLAEAGLNRLGLAHHVTERLGPPRFLPAVGQGALGIECRADDDSTRQLLACLDDPETHSAVIAERRVLFDLEGGCTIPLAAWARIEGGEFLLDAAVFSLDGREKIHAEGRGLRDDPESLARSVVAVLRDRGAERVLREVRPGWDPVP